MKKHDRSGSMGRVTLSSGESQKHEFTNDLSRVFQRHKTPSNVGLFASLHDNLIQGIVFRSNIPVTTPPATTHISRSLTCK